MLAQINMELESKELNINMIRVKSQQKLCFWQG